MPTMSQLDPGQVIKSSFDAVNGAIQVAIVAGGASGGTSSIDEAAFTEGATAFNPIGGVYSEVAVSDPTEDQAAAARITAKRAIHTNLRNNSGVEIATATNPARVDPTGTTPQPASQSGTWNINNVSGVVSLPTGASTEATLSSLNSKVVTVNTGAVVVSSSALPSGASTSALQTSGNASLSSIDSKVPALGQALAAASTPVVLTAAQLSTLTPLTSVTVTQATGANLHTVVDSSALPTGAATETSLGFVVTSSQQTSNNTAALNLSAGTTTAGKTGPMILGAVTSAAPTYAGTQLHPFSLTTAGALRVDNSAVTQPVSGSIKVAGKASSGFVRSDYSAVNVTTSAYVQLIASTSAAASEIFIFDSSGQTLKIAFGAAAAEVDQFIVVPGGNGTIPITVPAATRISIRALSATASVGEINLNLFG